MRFPPIPGQRPPAVREIDLADCFGFDALHYLPGMLNLGQDENATYPASETYLAEFSEILIAVECRILRDMETRLGILLRYSMFKRSYA